MALENWMQSEKRGDKEQEDGGRFRLISGTGAVILEPDCNWLNYL
jgi:hypothetical protein